MRSSSAACACLLVAVIALSMQQLACGESQAELRTETGLLLRQAGTHTTPQNTLSHTHRQEASSRRSWLVPTSKARIGVPSLSSSNSRPPQPPHSAAAAAWVACSAATHATATRPKQRPPRPPLQPAGSPSSTVVRWPVWSSAAGPHLAARLSAMMASAGCSRRQTGPAGHAPDGELLS